MFNAKYLFVKCLLTYVKCKMLNVKCMMGESCPAVTDMYARFISTHYPVSLPEIVFNITIETLIAFNSRHVAFGM